MNTLHLPLHLERLCCTHTLFMTALVVVRATNIIISMYYIYTCTLTNMSAHKSRQRVVKRDGRLSNALAATMFTPGLYLYCGLLLVFVSICVWFLCHSFYCALFIAVYSLCPNAFSIAFYSFQDVAYDFKFSIYDSKIQTGENKKESFILLLS